MITEHWTGRELLQLLHQLKNRFLKRKKKTMSMPQTERLPLKLLRKMSVNFVSFSIHFWTPCWNQTRPKILECAFIKNTFYNCIVITTEFHTYGTITYSIQLFIKINIFVYYLSFTLAVSSQNEHQKRKTLANVKILFASFLIPFI
jgi:predicted permease